MYHMHTLGASKCMHVVHSVGFAIDVGFGLFYLTYLLLLGRLRNQTRVRELAMRIYYCRLNEGEVIHSSRRGRCGIMYRPLNLGVNHKERGPRKSSFLGSALSFPSFPFLSRRISREVGSPNHKTLLHAHKFIS